MKTKSIFSLLLLIFVGISIVVAVRKIGPPAKSDSSDTAAAATMTSATTPVGLQSSLAESPFSAVYFHAPHRCPTCRTIESFTHEALNPEIEAGKISWQIADYTSDENVSLVKQFDVYTSTVVLVRVQDGEIVRWKNLEEVWNHTNDQVEFTDFINRSWNTFQIEST